MMMQNILQTSVLTQVYIWLLGILSKTKPRVRNKQMRAFHLNQALSSIYSQYSVNTQRLRYFFHNPSIYSVTYVSQDSCHLPDLKIKKLKRKFTVHGDKTVLANTDNCWPPNAGTWECSASKVTMAREKIKGEVHCLSPK